MLNFLQLKIPPLLLTLLVAAAMYAFAGPLTLSSNYRWCALLILFVGIAIMLLAALQFRRVHTTLNPISPDQASQLVTHGIFHYTRNPMYLGMALMLLAWSFCLSSILSLLGPLFFVLYMTYFQIKVEEQRLRPLFGGAYEAYLNSVRRWL